MQATTYTKKYKNGTTIKYDRTGLVKSIIAYPKGSKGLTTGAWHIYHGLVTSVADRTWSDIVRDRA